VPAWSPPALGEPARPPTPVRRRRDRRGRGLRGPLAPAQVPLRRTRAQRFDDLVLDAVERLEQRWSSELERVEFAVEDVPAPDERPQEPVPLGRLYPATGDHPPRVVLYRRPVEARASEHALAALVHDVVVEQVAELLGLAPEAVDPDYDADAEE